MSVKRNINDAKIYTERHHLCVRWENKKKTNDNEQMKMKL